MGCAASKDDKSLTEFERKAFDGLPADKKMDIIWQKIGGEKKGRGWNDAFIEQVKLLTDGDLTDVVEHTGDQVPSCTGKAGDKQRTKTIHLHGTHAIVEWRSFKNHNYTGVYAGAEKMLARFSIAAPAEWDKDKKDGSMIPGFALKVFRAPNEPSGNMICMHSLAGGPTNYFANDFTPHLAALNTDADSTSLANKLLAKKFATLGLISASKLGNSDLATHDSKDWKPLPKEDVKFPYRVVFHPPQEMRELFTKDDQYKPNPDDEHFVSNQMVQIPAGTVLFKVFAEDQPKDGLTAEPIGEVILREQFVTSEFGDNDLFFRHPTMNDDCKYHPDWEKAVREAEAEETQLQEPFKYDMAPDVPDPVVPAEAGDDAEEKKPDEAA